MDARYSVPISYLGVDGKALVRWLALPSRDR
jgi:hypothetical protein